MSDYVQKPMTINLFKFNRTKDTHPLMNGDIVIDLTELNASDQVEQVEVEVNGQKELHHVIKVKCSLWGKTAEKSGTKYWQGPVQIPKPKVEKHDDMPPEAGETIPETAQGGSGTDNDLPF